jgi:hypothetical protein
MSNEQPDFRQLEMWLLQASVYLPSAAKEPANSPSPDGRLIGSWAEFEEFLDVGEYGLAWDALAALGQNVTAPAPFWEYLSKAANAMGLDEQCRFAEERRRSA